MLGRSAAQERGKGAWGQGCNFRQDSLSLWGGGLTPGTGPDVGVRPVLGEQPGGVQREED